MLFEPTEIPEVILICPKRFGDPRGHFVEVFNQETLQGRGLNFVPVQENQSLSRRTGTVRGLHYQRDPFAQAKLVRVLRGAIFDVAVDIRPASSTFGHWVARHLSAEDGNQLFIPKGFAHGFCTIAPDTEIAYLVDAPYRASHDAAILWNDPQIAIEWPDAAGTVVSEKDQQAPRLLRAASASGS